MRRLTNKNWIGGLLGTVSFFPLFFKTLNSLYLENAGLSPVTTFIIGSVALWIITWIIVLGVRDAGIVNAIVTLMKMTPLFLIILLGVFAFKPELFLVPDWPTTLASSGNEPPTSHTPCRRAVSARNS